MTVAIVYFRALAGVDAPLVTVEVHAGGLPAFNLVGLPETEVKERRERVRAALQNAKFDFPKRRITVNLAPAELPKESGRFDLPIAIGILFATGQLPGNRLHEYEFAGELALSGELRAIRGALATTLKASGDGRAFILPAASATEAALVRAAVVYPASALLDVCAHLTGRALFCSRYAHTSPAAHCCLSRPRRWRLTRARTARIPISVTSKASRKPSARSRSPRQASTAC